VIPVDTWLWVLVAAFAGMVLALAAIGWEQYRLARIRRPGSVEETEPLTAPERVGYARKWSAIERHFPAQPDFAVEEAHDLVHFVMLERGYPIAQEPDARAAVVSVEYPELADEYRRANKVHLRTKQGPVPTGMLQHALVSYRALLGELLTAGPPERAISRV
jgi:hypothetical protein